MSVILKRMYREEFREEMARLAVGRDRMILAGQRIAIRLGSDKPIYNAYQSAITLVLEVIRKVYAEDRRRNQAGASRSELAPEELNSRLGAVEVGFVNEAVGLIRSQLPGP